MCVYLFTAITFQYNCAVEDFILSAGTKCEIMMVSTEKARKLYLLPCLWVVFCLFLSFFLVCFPTTLLVSDMMFNILHYHCLWGKMLAWGRGVGSFSPM